MGDETLTLGQYRVGLDFNPGNNPEVTEIKHAAAHLIDLVEKYKGNGPEVARLAALAQTGFEDAAMWAVKAATKKVR